MYQHPRSSKEQPTHFPEGMKGADTRSPLTTQHGVPQKSVTVPCSTPSTIPPNKEKDNFYEFFQTLDDMIFVGSPDGQILFSNRAASRKLGYTTEEFKTMLLIDLHPTELRRKAEEIVGAMVRGECESCPLPLEKRSGDLILVETRVWQGKWDGKECLFGLCRDITEKQETEQLFELLFRNNSALMALSTFPERIFVDVNAAFLSALGYSKEEVIGKTSLEIGIIPDALSTECTSAKLESDGRVYNMELTATRADGKLIEGLFSAEVVVMKSRRYLLSVMVDVTELRKTTRRLQESEERFRRTADTAPVLLWESGSDSMCTYFNKPWLEFTGRTLEQELGNGWAESVHPEDFQSCLDIYMEAFHARREFEMEYRLRRADGEYRWLHDHGVPRFMPDGNFLGFIGSCLDITESRQKEEKLTQLAGRLMLATKAGKVGIWDWDVGNDRLIWDDNMYRLYGITRDRFIGAYEAWSEGIHPDDRVRGDEEIQMALRGEKEFNTSFRVVWTDGSIHHIRAMAIVQRDAGGKPFHMIGTNWDITDQELRDSRLSEAAAYARSLIEVNLDPLITISPEGKITDVNEATIQVTGIPRTLLIESDFSVYFTDPSKARLGFRKVYDEGVLRDFSLTLRHSSGRTIDVLYNFAIYRNAQGMVMGVFAAARTITKQQRAEGIVLQNLARAEELAHLKSQFVSMASHELRTPLANIMLTCELLKNFGAAMPVDRSQTVLSSLMTSVSSMVRIIDDLLLAGNLEEGGLLCNTSSIFMHEFLKRCSLEVQPNLKSTSRIEIACSRAERVVADERLLHHILKNLLENALKYSPPDTRVDLTAKVMSDSFILSVLDRGIGVPEADRNLLFEPFSRASNVGERHGSGLGLFIALKCAQAHGGTIRYTPMQNGSFFSVIIPIFRTTT